MNADDRLKAAGIIARLGERERALEMFRAITVQQPDNVTAWLWISELAVSLEEQNEALEQALVHCPVDASGQRDLQSRLNILRETIPLPAPAAETSNKSRPLTAHSRAEKIRIAERMAIIDNHTAAVEIIKGIVEADPQDEQAWMLLSEAVADSEEKARIYHTVLSINPANEEAAQREKVLQLLLKDPLRRGQFLEENGEFAQAIQLYESVNVHSGSPAERLEASRRIASLQLQQEAQQAGPVHPTINLARLALGPLLLFVLMVFIQSGLQPLHTPLLAVPGSLCVLAGSLMVAVTGMRPAHPLWIQWLGKPGSEDEPQMRQGIRLLGWALMLAPFTIFLADAGYRLGVLRASMIQP